LCPAAPLVPHCWFLDDVDGRVAHAPLRPQPATTAAAAQQPTSLACTPAVRRPMAHSPLQCSVPLAPLLCSASPAPRQSWHHVFAASHHVNKWHDRGRTCEAASQEAPLLPPLRTERHAAPRCCSTAAAAQGHMAGEQQQYLQQQAAAQQAAAMARLYVRQRAVQKPRATGRRSKSFTPLLPQPAVLCAWPAFWPTGAPQTEHMVYPSAMMPPDQLIHFHRPPP
jgi:hypothetical protein